MSNEEIEALNKIVAMIDEKAAKYKNEYGHMPRARAAAEKKLVLDLIDNGIDLAKRITPPPYDLMDDLTRLQSQLKRLA